MTVLDTQLTVLIDALSSNNVLMYEFKTKSTIEQTQTHYESIVLLELESNVCFM